ncbi:Ubiquitin carboxyl-terminal hydrolase 21 [Phytophthora pseudosyringae]|uniref:Ubiquitin carboxyl-terminal hydrolase n=1 Tax=Phytophthora pseudosyringae TaxID=221518 RepID=A0A8T1VFE0_9STRA|nr:Ubiquitin carboxyl-terminal hydrolase 21 [Phytophthora pseudosyringae]
MAGSRLAHTSSTWTSADERAQLAEDNMFKQQDRSSGVYMRVPFTTRPKKVASSVTDSLDKPAATTKPPPIGGKILGRPANRAAASEFSAYRTSSATSALASLTRFHSRHANQSTASSCSVRERNNDDLDVGNSTSLNFPSVGSSELPRLAPSVGPSTSNMTTSNIVTSQATTTPSISYPARVSSSGRTSPRNDMTRKRHPRGLVGLQNLGNTCFMNSCLQCVSNLPAIVKYFQPGLYACEINDSSPTKGALANAFGNLIKALWTGDKFTATRPVELKRVIGKVASRFTGYDQQDAQEFLRFLLDGLHEDLNRVKKKPAYYEIKDRPDAKDRDVSDEYWKFYLERNASALSELFCGQLRSEIRCETCSHRSLCFDVFWDLSLPVPKKKPGRNSAASHLRVSSSFFSGGRTASATSDAAASDSATAGNGGMSIHDCLKAYTEQELLSDDAAYYCAKCKTHRSVSKKISVYRLPNVLVLHLKRFSYSTFSRDKVSTTISFPAQSLDIAEYCARDAVVDGSTLYDLTGIVHHMGSLNGGHYTAECLNADTQEWFDFNDASVTAIKRPEISSSSAYMLFYQRREEKSLTI